MVAIVSWLNSGSLRLTRRSCSMTARYPHGYDRGDHATSAGRLDGAAARHLGRQPGRHLLAWRLRRGPQALPAAGSGVHGYVPNLTGVTFGTAGAAVLAALYVIGAARAAPLGRAMLRAA